MRNGKIQRPRQLAARPVQGIEQGAPALVYPVICFTTTCESEYTCSRRAFKPSAHCKASPGPHIRRHYCPASQSTWRSESFPPPRHQSPRPTPAGPGFPSTPSIYATKSAIDSAALLVSHEARTQFRQDRKSLRTSHACSHPNVTLCIALCKTSPEFHRLFIKH